jgi:hypothetical protein
MKGEHEARVKLNLGDPREGANPRCGGVTVTMMVARLRCPRLEGGRSRTTLSTTALSFLVRAQSLAHGQCRGMPHGLRYRHSVRPRSHRTPVVMRWTALQLSDGFLP